MDSSPSAGQIRRPHHTSDRFTSPTGPQAPQLHPGPSARRSRAPPRRELRISRPWRSHLPLRRAPSSSASSSPRASAALWRGVADLLCLTADSSLRRAPRRGAAAPPPPWRHAGACRHGGTQALPAWLREGLLPRRLPSSLAASKGGRSGGRRRHQPRVGGRPRTGGRDRAAGGGPFSASSSAPSLAGAPLPPSGELKLGPEPASTEAAAATAAGVGRRRGRHGRA